MSAKLTAARAVRRTEELILSQVIDAHEEIIERDAEIDRLNDVIQEREAEIERRGWLIQRRDEELVRVMRANERLVNVLNACPFLASDWGKEVRRVMEEIGDSC